MLKKPFPYDNFSVLKGFLLAQNLPSEIIRCMDNIARWHILDSEPSPAELKEKSYIMIEDAGDVSIRTVNCLREADLKTLGDLMNKTEAEMLRIPNFGRKSLNELRSILENHGLKFKVYDFA